AWMIVSQIISVLIISGLAFLGLFLNALGGGELGWMNFMFFSSVVLFIPMVATWVVYKKKKTRAALILTFLPFLFFILNAVGIGLFWLYLNLISSGP
ncbi:MAG: hypothetical protein WCG34_10785, partial [Leptolinea sp.]